MKAGPECRECLEGLAHQATELATPSPEIRRRIWAEVARIMERLSPDVVPTDISNEFHALIKKISGNPDPYRGRKMREIEASRLAFSRIKPARDLRSCVEVAAQGNAIDFFVDHRTLMQSLEETPKFAIDDIDLLERRLADASEILYLSDNAGEAFFDLPLVKALGRRARVTYTVKEAPIQNDLTLEDLRLAGLTGDFKYIAEAPATVGLYLGRASPEFRARFDRADLVVAKGMGNYETLSELPPRGNIFYILRAKCWPVARSLGVEVGDYVAMLR
jgi:uncharacterized protein with ATP-grasp and redox domains